jgi:UDP-glucose 4-epimerase
LFPDGLGGETSPSCKKLITLENIVGVFALAAVLNCFENVFGNDYDTPDGSCIRDFINVVDLAKAHVTAIARLLEKKQKAQVEVFNIGTGRGLSVLELINAFEKATGVKLNYQIVGRRAGDIEKVWADPSYANKELGWKAETSVEDTLRSAWNWQLKLRERGIQ